jgi:diketogulonate reductase-like aldo/keto reductase
LGIGTWQLPESPQLVESLVGAIKMGYRYIDTAAIYENEASVGEAIRMSGVAREDMFVLSKCWTAHRTYDSVLRAFDDTMKRLRLDYLDCYLIHWPCTKGDPLAWQSVNIGTWRAFERLYEEGVVKSIGVSNFLVHHLVSFLSKANVKPAINQLEYHPGYRQQKAVQFCQKEGIQVQAWSPLGHGALVDVPEIAQIGAAHGKSTTQVILRWCLQNNVLPIMKSRSAEHQRENMAIYDFELTPEEMAAIDALPLMGFSGLEPDHVSF